MDKKYWALAGVCLLAFTAFLDYTIVNTALPFIQAALKTTILELQWVANIFPIILSMTMIAMGKLADLWGRKRVFYFGILLFGIAALGAGCSPSVGILVFFRGLQALGASTVFIASGALLTDIFPKEERVRAISIYGGVTGFALMIGPFFGGVLIELLNWRWVFWINLPLIAAGLAICFFSLGDIPREQHSVKLDRPGLFLLIFGLGALMYGIIAGSAANWSSLTAWILLGAGLFSLVLLVVLDKMRKNPLLDLLIFKENLVLLSILSCAAAGVASNVFMFFDPLYLRILRGLSPFLIGLLIAVIPAAQSCMSLVFSRAVSRFGVANLLFFSVVAALLGTVLHRFIGMHTPLLYLVLPFFLLGINWGLSNSAMMTAVNEVIAPKKIAEALGTIATTWNIAGALLLAFSAAVFHASEAKNSFLPAFQSVVDFNIIFAAVVLICSMWIRRRLRNNSN